MIYKTSKYDTSHGSPFDRGGADAYYGRGAKPHWYPEGTYNGECITEERMTTEQIKAYYSGYGKQVESGEFKNWF